MGVKVAKKILSREMPLWGQLVTLTRHIQHPKNAKIFHKSGVCMGTPLSHQTIFTWNFCNWCLFLYIEQHDIAVHSFRFADYIQQQVLVKVQYQVILECQRQNFLLAN